MKSEKEIAAALEAFKKKHGVDPLIDGDKDGLSLTCPYCGAKEVTPLPEGTSEKVRKGYALGLFWCIRAYKVDNASHCIVCDQWFT